MERGACFLRRFSCINSYPVIAFLWKLRSSRKTHKHKQAKDYVTSHCFTAMKSTSQRKSYQCSLPNWHLLSQLPAFVPPTSVMFNLMFLDTSPPFIHPPVDAQRPICFAAIAPSQAARKHLGSFSKASSALAFQR